MLKSMTSPAIDGQFDVFFNGNVLPQESLLQLRAIGLSLPLASRCWYDPVSGWWGFEGEAATGQLPPGLALGGPLQADASGGGTGAFVNGRELHPAEVRQLTMLFGAVPRIRFWMNAHGIGGPEGGPATFSLQAAAQARQRAHGGTLRRGTFGTTGGDGGSFCYVDPASGASVMLGD